MDDRKVFLFRIAGQGNLNTVTLVFYLRYSINDGMEHSTLPRQKGSELLRQVGGKPPVIEYTYAHSRTTVSDRLQHVGDMIRCQADEIGVDEEQYLSIRVIGTNFHCAPLPDVCRKVD